MVELRGKLPWSHLKWVEPELEPKPEPGNGHDRNCRDKKDLAEAKRKMDDRKLLINSPAQLTQFCDHIRFDLWSHPSISISEVSTTGLVPTTCCCTSVYSMQWMMADIGMDDRWSLNLISPHQILGSVGMGGQEHRVQDRLRGTWSLIFDLIFDLFQLGDDNLVKTQVDEAEEMKVHFKFIFENNKIITESIHGRRLLIESTRILSCNRLVEREESSWWLICSGPFPFFLLQFASSQMSDHDLSTKDDSCTLACLVYR